MQVSKGQGTGNDFVILGDPEGTTDLSPECVRALCDRRFGVGADGVLRVVPTAAVAELARWADQAPWAMDYRNADGSVAEMCGNGIRVQARWMVAHGLLNPGRHLLATRAGVREVEVPAEGDVTVEMGPVRLSETPAEVDVAGVRVAATAVDLGNPHVVVACDDLPGLGVLALPEVRPAVPGGVNVEYVTVTAAQALSMRVHERGSGETMSCGTGAVAAAAAAQWWSGRAEVVDGVLQTPDRESWEVTVAGGRLTVLLHDGRSWLRGPAVLVADVDLLTGWH